MPVAPAVQTSEAALVLVAGAAEMGLPGIFCTQAIRSSHVKGASMLGGTLLSVLNETSLNSKNKETFQIEGFIQLKRISNSLKRCQNYLCCSHSKLSFPSQADVVPSPMKFPAVLFKKVF